MKLSTEVILPGNFYTFDISINDPVIITASSINTSEIYNYQTKITHILPTKKISHLKFYPSGHTLVTKLIAKAYMFGIHPVPHQYTFIQKTLNITVLEMIIQ